MALKYSCLVVNKDYEKYEILVVSDQLYIAGIFARDFQFFTDDNVWLGNLFHKVTDNYKNGLFLYMCCFLLDFRIRFDS